MRLGVNLVRVRPVWMPGLAVRAEGLGFESVFVPDHVVVPVEFVSRYPGTADGGFPYPTDTPLYDPWVVLASIAQETTSIRLGTAIYVAGLRHPLVTAREVVTLDALSGGRVILGVGVGWLREEFEALGIDPRSRFSRTEEVTVALRRLWAESEPSFHGKHFSFERVHFEPKPVCVPPILFGGDSDAALRRALRFGDGWMSGGVATDVEQVCATVGRIGQLREQLADEPDAGVAGAAFDADRRFNITVLYPNPSASDLAAMAEAGVDRVVVMPWDSNRDAGDALERFRAVAAGVDGIEFGASKEDR